MSCVISTGGAFRGNLFCAFIFAVLSISAVTSQFYLSEELSQGQVGEILCVTSRFPHILFIHHYKPEAWKDWHRVFQGQMLPTLRYFTEMGNYLRGATENSINPRYSTTLRDDQVLYIFGYRNMPSSFQPLFCLIYIAYCSLTFGVFVYREGGLFFVTDPLQHYRKSLLLSRALQNVPRVEIPHETAYQISSRNPLNLFTLFPLALGIPCITTRAAKTLWNSGGLTSAVTSSGSLKWTTEDSRNQEAFIPL